MDALANHYRQTNIADGHDLNCGWGAGADCCCSVARINEYRTEYRRLRTKHLMKVQEAFDAYKAGSRKIFGIWSDAVGARTTADFDAVCTRKVNSRWPRATGEDRAHAFARAAFTTLWDLERSLEHGTK